MRYHYANWFFQRRFRSDYFRLKMLYLLLETTVTLKYLFGPLGELNPRPLAPKARIIPLDQTAFLLSHSHYLLLCFIKPPSDLNQRHLQCSADCAIKAKKMEVSSGLEPELPASKAGVITIYTMRPLY